MYTTTHYNTTTSTIYSIMGSFFVHFTMTNPISTSIAFNGVHGSFNALSRIVFQSGAIRTEFVF